MIAWLKAQVQRTLPVRYHPTAKILAETLRRAQVAIKGVIPAPYLSAARRLWYLGFRFACPCCGKSFRRFMAFGVVPRPHARCPGCLCLERHRLLFLYLRDCTTFFTSALRVLHVAPMAILQRRFNMLYNFCYVSVTDAFDTFAGSVPNVRSDVARLGFGDEVFDVVLCSHVLEHLPNDRKALQELLRVLKPSGWAIIQVPIWSDTTVEDPTVLPRDRERVFGQWDHLRKYGPDFKTRPEEAGFAVKVNRYASELDSRTVVRHCLLPEEALFICIRPQARVDGRTNS